MVEKTTRIGKQYANPLTPLNLKGDNRAYREMKKNPNQTIVKIIKSARNLFNKEISYWKAARAQAENPYYYNRVMLMDLYHDIVIDSMIHGLIYNKRILKVSNKPFKITDSKGNENEDLKKLLDKNWMTKFVKHAMESNFFGHSLVHFKRGGNYIFENTELIPREHVLPEYDVFVSYRHDMPESGFKFKEAPYNSQLLGVGEKYNLGILNHAAPLYILKKHSWANWDEFEEIFGVPIRIGKVASSEKSVIDEVEGWLQDMGTAGYGVFPIDTEIDIKENNRSDAFEVFDRKRKAANEELEVLITGNRSVTQDSGNYGKEKVLQEETNEVILDDMKMILHVMNESLLPLLIQNGFPLKGHTFSWDETEWLDPKERLDMFKGVKDLGFELDQEQVQKDLGVTITGVSQQGQNNEGFSPFLNNMNVGQRLINMHKNLKNVYKV